MKNNIVSSLILMVLTSVILVACTDDTVSPSGSDSTRFTLVMNILDEERVDISTKALTGIISDVGIAVVKNDQPIEYRYYTSSEIIGNKVMISDLPISSTDTLYIFCNTGIPNISSGITKDELLRHFVCTQEQVNTGMMYGVSPEQGTVSSSNSNRVVDLYRVPAKVTVRSIVDGHSVTQFKVCRVPASGYLSNVSGYPNGLNNDAFFNTTVMPTDDIAYVIPRKDNSSLAVTERTCLLVQLDGKIGWYRLDFYIGKEPVTSTTATFENIIRNNWYNFTITSIKSDGYKDENEALANVGSNVIYKLDVSSSSSATTNGQYALMASKEEIVMVNDKVATIDISALLPEGVTLSTYEVELENPNNCTISFENTAERTIKFLPENGTITSSDDSGRTVKLNLVGGTVDGCVLVVRLGNITKRIPIRVGTANSYIVDFSKEGTIFKIPVAHANSDGTIRIQGDNVEPVWIWNDVPAALSSFQLTYNTQDKTIDVTCKETYTGNIVIGASIGGEIKWSWHLWCMVPNQGKDMEEYTFCGEAWMDRDLGAYNLNDKKGRLGLLYQYGRKDPFIGDLNTVEQAVEPTIYYGDRSYTLDDFHPEFGNKGKNHVLNIPFSGSDIYAYIKYAIAHPYIIIGGEYLDLPKLPGRPGNFDYDWMATTLNNRNEIGDIWLIHGEKSIYDPCPYGWRIPVGDPLMGMFGGLNEIKMTKTDEYYYWPDKGYFYYEAYRSAFDGAINGSRQAQYWYSGQGGYVPGVGSLGLTFWSTRWDASRSEGHQIRCVKDRMN